MMLPSDVIQAAWRVVRAVAVREGFEDELRDIDITIDYFHKSRRSGYFIRVTAFGTLVSEYVVDDEYVMGGEIQKHVSHAMESNLHLVAQLHHARLALRFPNRIKDVTVEINVERDSKTITVHFKNGHTATADELEVRGDLFLARCMMLYDLPTL